MNWKPDFLEAGVSWRKKTSICSLQQTLRGRQNGCHKIGRADSRDVHCSPGVWHSQPSNGYKINVRGMWILSVVFPQLENSCRVKVHKTLRDTVAEDCAEAKYLQRGTADLSQSVFLVDLPTPDWLSKLWLHASKEKWRFADWYGRRRHYAGAGGEV